jgi:hypothetical protein
MKNQLRNNISQKHKILNISTYFAHKKNDRFTFFYYHSRI